MKTTFLAFVLPFLTASAHAKDLTLHCQFLPRTQLQDFTVTLTDETAQLNFQGSADEREDLDPSGEKALLKRQRLSQDWLSYHGMEVMKSDSPCTYYINNVCAAPARGFELSIAQEDLKKSQIPGHLNMTALSGYLPGEAYYSHSVTCTRN